MKSINAQNELNDQSDDMYPTTDAIIYSLVELGYTILTIGGVLGLFLYLFY